MTGLPYKFEPGMRIIYAGGGAYLVVDVRADGNLMVDDDESVHPGCCAADLDHPGTRGLLLEQYRKASGHKHAAPVWVDLGHVCGWVMANDPTDPPRNDLVGAEGVAILDALTRLATKQAEPEWSEHEIELRLIRKTLAEHKLANISDPLADMPAAVERLCKATDAAITSLRAAEEALTGAGGS